MVHGADLAQSVLRAGVLAEMQIHLLRLTAPMPIGSSCRYWSTQAPRAVPCQHAVSEVHQRSS